MEHQICTTKTPGSQSSYSRVRSRANTARACADPHDLITWIQTELPTAKLDAAFRLSKRSKYLLRCRRSGRPLMAAASSATGEHCNGEQRGELTAERPAVAAAGDRSRQFRKIPERTALAPATRLTVIVTVPPSATLIGNVIHAPVWKSLDKFVVWLPTVIVSRRASESQSTA